MKYFVLVLLAVAAVASAQIYKWTDETGRVHFSDSAPVGQHVEKVTPEINGYDPVPATVQAAGSERVVMYATSWCPYCRQAREYFRDNGIPFVEYDIEKDAAARRRYDALGGRGVPVILVGDRRMNGFSVPGFKKLYR